MPDHTPVGTLGTFTGQTGAIRYALPVGTKAVLLTYTAVGVGSHFNGPSLVPIWYGIGHYQWEIGTYAGSLGEAVTGSGPIRSTRQYLAVPTGHEDHFRLWLPTGSVATVNFVY